MGLEAQESNCTPIHIFVTTGDGENDLGKRMLDAYAVATGKGIIYKRFCSNVPLAKQDMGLKSSTGHCHKEYEEHCPEGYYLVWHGFMQKQKAEEEMMKIILKGVDMARAV